MDKKARDLLQRAAERLQWQAPDTYNDYLAMEIFEYLENTKEV